MFSHIFQKVSRQELSIDVAEQVYVKAICLPYSLSLRYKTTKIRTSPVIVSHPKQVKHSLKRVFCFYCVTLIIVHKYIMTVLDGYVAKVVALKCILFLNKLKCYFCSFALKN